MGSAEDYERLASDLQRIIKATADTVASSEPSNELVEKVTSHLGLRLSQVMVVGQEWQDWEHANLQRGVDAYLAERGTDAAWFGVAGGHRGGEELVNMLSNARRHGMYELSAVDFATVAIGPDKVTEVVQLGLVATTAPDGTPVILGVRGANPQYAKPLCRLEVLSAVREVSTAVRDRIEALMVSHDVLRGQVLAFGTSENRGNELLTFLPRPTLTDEEIVLPTGVLDAIEWPRISRSCSGGRRCAAS